jgi:hypothetical protein
MLGFIEQQILKSISLPKPNTKVEIPLITENPYCKILSIHTFDLLMRELVPHGIQLCYTVQRNANMGNLIMESINFVKSQLGPDYFINTTINLKNAEKFFVEYRFPEDEKDFFDSLEYPISISYHLVDYLEVDNHKNSFKLHINNHQNNKILFSAPFGQGKSTFLDLFFFQDPYFRVSKLYPVNYSVASNEDIFKYIKADILLQLLALNVSLSLKNLTLEEGVLTYFLNNPVTAISGFVKSASKLNKTTSTIVKAVETFVSKIKTEKEKLEEDDLKHSVKFIEELIEIEGSLLEDNLITQIIRDLIVDLKYNDKARTLLSSTKNVLLIDDLDRMDPEHIFRIMNVFSAHFDHFIQEGEFQNKFGFDKIILVCDYQNLSNIYKHKYGINTDFKGYISKYYSTEVYHYNNIDVSKSFIIGMKNSQRDESFGIYFDHFKIIAEALIESGQLTLRDLIKMNSFSLTNIIKQLRNKDELTTKYHRYASFTPALHLLIRGINLEPLLRMIQNLHAKHFRLKEEEFDKLTTLVLDLIIGLQNYDNKKVKIYVVKNNISFEIDWNNNSILGVYNFMFDGKPEHYYDSPFKPAFEDFKELLIRNIERTKDFL